MMKMEENRTNDTYCIYVARSFKNQSTPYNYRQNNDAISIKTAEMYTTEEIPLMFEHIDKAREIFKQDKFLIKKVKNRGAQIVSEKKLRIQNNIPFSEEIIERKKYTRQLQNKEIAKRLNYELLVLRKTPMTNCFAAIDFVKNNVGVIKKHQSRSKEHTYGTIFRMNDYNTIIKQIQEWQNSYRTHAYKICYRPSPNTVWKLFEMFEPLIIKEEQENESRLSDEK